MAYFLHFGKHRRLGAMALAEAAINILAKSVKMDGSRQLNIQDGMPPLPDVELVLWQRESSIQATADHLAADIVNDVGVLSQPNLTHAFTNDRSTAYQIAIKTPAASKTKICVLNYRSFHAVFKLRQTASWWNFLTFQTTTKLRVGYSSGDRS